MIGRVLPFLSRSISNPLAFKGIQKVSPKLGKFLETGIKEGLPLAAGMEFLRRQFSSESSDVDQTMRPDERASQASQDRSRRNKEMALNAAKLGTGFTGAGLLSLFGDEETQQGQTQDRMAQQQTPTNDPNAIDQMDQKNQEIQTDPNAIDQILAEIHDSSMGQYIRKSVQMGSDPMEIISTIMLKTPERVHDIEKKTGDRFENVIDAYIKKIMGGSNVQAPEAAPQQQQQGGGMEQLMSVLQQVRDARQRRAGQ